MTPIQTLILFINIFMVVMMLGMLLSSEQRHYNALAEALVLGCQHPDENIYSNHPLTKGKIK